MINKSALMRSASRTTGLSLRDTSACIDSVIDVLGGAISAGERVELRGLGSFSVRQTAARKAVFGDIPSHGRIVFRPAQKLREAVWNNAGGRKTASK